MSDLDNDGILNDNELNFFQVFLSINFLLAMPVLIIVEVFVRTLLIKFTLRFVEMQK